MAEGEGMTKSTSKKQKKYDEWEVRDAMHTMLRAGEIVKDKHLMGHVRKHAADHAKKTHEVAQRAAHLAKSGRISEKQMAKLAGGNGDAKTETANIDKMTPIA
jgi:hypothetical protein